MSLIRIKPLVVERRPTDTDVRFAPVQVVEYDRTRRVLKNGIIVEIITGKCVRLIWVRKPCARGCTSVRCPLIRTKMVNGYVAFPDGLGDPPECGSQPQDYNNSVAATRKPTQAVFAI